MLGLEKYCSRCVILLNIFRVPKSFEIHVRHSKKLSSATLKAYAFRATAETKARRQRRVRKVKIRPQYSRRALLQPSVGGYVTFLPDSSPFTLTSCRPGPSTTPLLLPSLAYQRPLQLPNQLPPGKWRVPTSSRFRSPVCLSSWAEETTHLEPLVGAGVSKGRKVLDRWILPLTIVLREMLVCKKAF